MSAVEFLGYTLQLILNGETLPEKYLKNYQNSPIGSKQIPNLSKKLHLLNGLW